MPGLPEDFSDHQGIYIADDSIVFAHHISALSELIIAITTFAALVGATVHLYVVQSAEKQASDTTEAHFLLDLDQKSISNDMLKAQKFLANIWERK